jgi:hypothetical protein
VSTAWEDGSDQARTVRPGREHRGAGLLTDPARRIVPIRVSLSTEDAPELSLRVDPTTSPPAGNKFAELRFAGRQGEGE